MSVALNAVYLIALCVCGWRVIYRAVTRTRGESVPFDALLWLAAVVLIPVVADVTNVSGWGDPDTLYPTILSVGGIIGLLAWDVRSMWSRARRRAVPDVS